MDLRQGHEPSRGNKHFGMERGREGGPLLLFLCGRDVTRTFWETSYQGGDRDDEH